MAVQSSPVNEHFTVERTTLHLGDDSPAICTMVG